MQNRLRSAAGLFSVAIAGTAVLAGCGGGVDSGGLSVADRNAAQAAMLALQGSNISMQLSQQTAVAGLAPAACRVHLVSRKPKTFKVFVFWAPYVGPSSYTWIDMTLVKDPRQDKFHLGTAGAIAGGGLQLPGGRIVAPALQDYELPLKKEYGNQYAKVIENVMMAHAPAHVFSKPGAPCQVLMNGLMRLLPNP
jgi:hypothetical protein